MTEDMEQFETEAAETEETAEDQHTEAAGLAEEDFTFARLDKIFAERFGESRVPSMRHKSFKLTPPPPPVSGNAYRTLTIGGIKVLRRVSQYGISYSWKGDDECNYKIIRSHL